MIRAHYDVVVVGARLASLAAAALLGKRGHRVLVLAHDELSPTYPLGPFVLPRAAFNFLPASSAAARRLVSELALQTTFRQRAAAIDPAFQVVLPTARFDLAADRTHLVREIEREFPEVSRTVLAAFDELGTLTEHLDRALDVDLTWPPETFFERREHSRALRGLEQALEKLPDLLAALPEGHPFRLVVQAPARFADAIDPDGAHGIRLARLFGLWTTGGAVLPDGYATLRSALVASIRAHGGEVRERERVDQISVRRGAVEGVRIAASGEEIGASWVLAGTDVATLLRLVPDRRPMEELFERTGEPTPRYYRYTLNVVVREHGVPVGLARDAFLVRDPSRPLSGASFLHVEAHPRTYDGDRLLVVEALLPRRGVEDVPGYIETVRDDVLASLGHLVPFLGDHLVLVDSPHDGRPPQSYRDGLEVTAPKWDRGPRTMEPVCGFPIVGSFGLTALPVRTPVKNLLLASREVVPGLGLEGELIAALSAARVVSKAAPGKVQLLRRPFGSFGR